MSKSKGPPIIENSKNSAALSSKIDGLKRQLKIESALEQIRERAITMRHSDQLREVIQEVFVQLNKLGLNPQMCCIDILEKGSKDFNLWIATASDDYPQKVNIPYFDHPLFNEYHKAIKNRRSLYTANFSRSIKNSFYDHAFEHSDLRMASKKRKDFLSKSKGYSTSIAITRNLTLGVVNYDGLDYTKEDNEILVRITKVFDQAYTRFLDIQKAEAQTREALIEVALERVRARTMAMQQSEELREIVKVVFEKLTELNFAIDGGVFVGTIPENTDHINYWVGNDQTQYPDSFKIPRFNAPTISDVWEAIETGIDFISKTYSFKEKNIWFEYAFKNTELKTALPDKFKKWILEQENLTQSFAIQKNSMVGIHFHHKRELTENEIDILKRFSRVFDLTYTRFLDLKKAEEQAREAQIEVALERVRARTMAMQHSDELANVATVLFQQVKALGIPQWTCGFDIWEIGEEVATFYPGSPDGEILAPCQVPLTVDPVFILFNDSRKRGEDLCVYELKGEEQAAHYRYMHSLPGGVGDLLQSQLDAGFQFPAFQIDHIANFSHGNLIFVTYEHFPEMHNVFKRFAKVFEQTYARFLDLRKAEEQAREAQIEAALGKTRNRTLLMKDSGELNEAVAVFFQQFQTLDLLPAEARTYFCHIDADTDVAEVWMTHADGTVMTGSHQTPLTKSTSLSQYYEAWKEGKPILERIYTGTELKEYLKFVSSLPHVKADKDYQKLFRSPPKQIVMTDANFLQGNIGIMTFKPLTQEAKDTLIRFAKVFEFTYTRFLDLQKAENQAREAQIEVALERVRARTMAMQKSDELLEVVQILFEQINNLNIHADFSGFGMDFRESNDWNLWAADALFQYPVQMHVPYLDHPQFNRLIEARDNGLDFQECNLTFEEKNKLWDHIFKYVPVLEAKEVVYNCAGHASSWVLLEKVVFYVSNMAGVPFSDAENAIFIRFGKVFEQTYTRFSDLKQAEEQAREAQIEAALERVRSKSMAMHQTEELWDVICVVFKQFALLDITLDSCYIDIFKEGDKDQHAWIAAGKEMYPEQVHLPYIKHPVFEKSLKARAKGENFYVLDVDRKSKDRFFDHFYRYAKVQAKRKKLIFDRPGLSASVAVLPHASITIFNYSRIAYSEEENEILQRIGKVFEQTYTRFLDLQKAEEQAREAQIEAALERVRSKSMAMHQTEQLWGVIKVVFEQFKLLNITLDTCYINIFEENSRDFHLWVASRTELYPEQMRIPFLKHSIFQRLSEARAKGAELYTLDIDRKSKDRFYDHMFKNATNVKFTAKRKQAALRGTGFTSSVAVLQYASIGINNFNRIIYSDEENEILRRIGKVFEQTYTRFLDLQKAEEQAREAQIEAALERVRSKSMAMHQTEQLWDVIKVVFEQFKLLNITLDICYINIFEENSQDFHLWVASRTELYPEQMRIPFFKHPIFQRLSEARAKGAEFYTLDIDRKSKDRFYDHMFKNATNVKFTAKRKQAVLRGTGLTLSVAVLQYASIGVNNFNRVIYSEEENEILRRIGKVFEQTYTRFLDLKKAEEQAREAQIEASLERVRAKAMAMHSSEDLTKTVGQLFQELNSLDIGLLRCGVGRVHKDTRVVDLYTFTSINKENPVPVVGKLLLSGHPLLDSYFRHWEKQQDYQHVLKGVSLKEYYQSIKADYKLPGKQDSPVHYGYFFTFSAGVLFAFTETKCTEEELSIFRKFSSVVGLTYRRYLDLMEAEAQAREAQIEMALERVRAATMGMQKSENLVEVATILYNQLLNLNISQVTESSIVIIDQDNSQQVVWTGKKDADSLQMSTLPLLGDHVLQAVFDAWDKQDTFYTIKVGGKELENHQEFVLPKANRTRKENRALAEMPDPTYFNCAFFAEGYLELITGNEIDEESSSILIRFAKVFDQTYTRFLDLKKAEAQAREAQIEAALERVRSKSMAMHQTEQLWDVIAVVFEQFSLLNITLDSCFINTFEEGDQDLHMWIAAGKEMYPEQVHLPYIKHPVFDRLLKARAKGENFFLLDIDRKSKDRLFDHFYRYAKVQAKRKQLIFDGPGLSASAAVLPHASITIFNYSRIAYSKEENEILHRIGKVFEQTYTRFLDLQKAEEQAREAQIEASLERVRAKAMAMHSSEDLTETVGQLFRELDLLDITILRCGVGRIHKDTRVVDLFTFTSSNKGEPVPVVGKAILSGHPVLNGIFQHWERQKEYHPVLKGASLKKYYQALKADYKLPGKQVSPVHNGYVFPFSAGVLYAFTHTRLTKEELSIFRKFSSVVGLTYRRYLDLMEAEEQTREAQIEASLERVRAKAMAMHNSKDIGTTTAVMFNELKSLGVETLRTGITIIDEKQKTIELWMTKASEQHDNVQVMGKIPANSNPLSSSYLASWKKGEKVWSYVLSGDKLKQHYESLATYSYYPKNRTRFNKQEYSGGFFFSDGGISTVTLEPLSEEAISILQRFAGVFDMTYRRFLDLKKAETQARAALIEAALERVRSAAMAMHNSQDIGAATAIMFRELKSLGIDILRAGISIIDEKQKDIELWMSKASKQNDIVQVMGKIPAKATPSFSSYLASWKKGEKVWSYVLTGTKLKQYYESLAAYSFFPGKKRRFNKLEYMGGFFFSDGGINTVTLEPLSEEAISILQRFAGVFDLTYRRFLDLKKAEEQAQEGQTEAALERVRSAAMAMHSSNDLFSVAGVLHDQLGELGQKELESSIIHIYPDHLPSFEAWYIYHGNNDKESRQVMDTAFIPKNACAWTREVMTRYKSKKMTYLIELRGKKLLEWYQVLEKVAPAVIDYDDHGNIIVPMVLYYHFSKFSGGALLMVSNEPPTKESQEMQLRASQVFDLAYRRFLDLQRAEAQAREAQIEASLERVRASTMAMHSSDNVGEATMVLFQELENLGIETLRCGIAIIDKNRTMEAWSASNFAGDSIFNISGIVDMTIHPLLNQLFEDWQSEKDMFTYELEGKDVQRYYRAIKNLPDYEIPGVKNLPARQFSTGFLFKEGALYAFTKDPFTDETSAIFQKFTNVFTLTYRRYLDLIQAERRENEAIKQSSLDRVRAEIASMRNTDDLQRITPLVWSELQSLGVPFFRCGVFIMDEDAETVHMYLSKPTGESLAAVHLDFDDEDIPLVRDAIDHWKTQTVHRTHWDRQQFKIFTQSLKRRGLISNLKTYQQGEKPPESLNLHQVPFKQGMLYVGSSEPLPDDQIELIQSLADAFSVAYSRYEDFVQLEGAKESVENTLTELKSAQDQLVHSEKMASLGELTAGIAHEIQNPLNFVNNFSEVSNELLSEMKEEIENGNNEEVVELVEDLMQNLDKIAHHGKRASGIVKGMLDHSRASSDEKVFTDINVLADEYLRLAYHGLRAKDKSFNANFKTMLADDLPKINIVGQDIGRVLLNLINNAFHAVKEVEKPEVTVKTQIKDGMVEISVKDNGSGIPEDIKEKIFQPFFTTKAAGEGTGLGLSLSYDIVTKGHGGTIEVKSKEREGTEFVIYLPG